MPKTHILFTVLILLPHLICGQTTTPPPPNETPRATDPAPIVQPPDPGSYKPAVNAPPPPTLYNDKVSGGGNSDGTVKVPPHPVAGPPYVPPPTPPPTDAKPYDVVDPKIPVSIQPPHPHVDPRAGSNPQFNKGNAVSFSSSSQNGPGNKQCSFTVSNPNTFHASTNGFGYPRNIVDAAANNNPLVKAIFQKYREQKNSGSGTFSGANRPSQIPGFGIPARHIPAFPGFGGGGEVGGDHGLDIGSMFDRIGKHADNDALGHFPRNPNFPDPDKAIIPGRTFGPGSQLQSSLHRQNPFFSNFGGLNFRRKRQTSNGFGSGFQNQLEPVCPSTTDYIRTFKKYNSDCYVYEPELQGRKMAECTKAAKSKNCAHCGASGKCVEERQSAYLWSYCQGGPNARKVEPEYVEFPAYCVCKTIQC